MKVYSEVYCLNLWNKKLVKYFCIAWEHGDQSDEAAEAVSELTKTIDHIKTYLREDQLLDIQAIYSACIPE